MVSSVRSYHVEKKSIYISHLFWEKFWTTSVFFFFFFFFFFAIMTSPVIVVRLSSSSCLIRLQLLMKQVKKIFLNLIRTTKSYQCILVRPSQIFYSIFFILCVLPLNLSPMRNFWIFFLLFFFYKVIIIFTTISIRDLLLKGTANELICFLVHPIPFLLVFLLLLTVPLPL